MPTPPGKGTSAKDGSALSGALLEHLDQRRISGIFSTHLHELFRLPLRLKSVTDKKMGFAVDDTGELHHPLTVFVLLVYIAPRTNEMKN
jgi:DNA mismatch repair ATPase MutS